MNFKNHLRKFARDAAAIGTLIAVTVFALVSAVRMTGAIQPIELSLYDSMLSARANDASADARISLITITDADISALGHWPMNDERLADAIDVLLAAQPRALGFDLYRDLAVPPGSERLEAILQSSDRLFFAEKFGSGDEPAVPPPPALRGSGQIGFADLMVDPGGVVRRALLFLDDGERVSYSLPLRLVLRYLADDGIGPQPGEPDATHMKLGATTIRPFAANDGGYVDADERGYQFLLDFDAGLTPFATFTLSEVLDRKVPASALKGKVVLVGVTADSVKDFFQSPFTRDQSLVASIPGMYLHAQAARQLLRMALEGTRPLAVFSDLVEGGWILSWAVIGVLLSMRMRTLLRLSLATLCAWGSLVGLAYIAFTYGWWLPLAPPAIALLLASVIVLAYQTGLERRERRFIMEIFSKHVSGDVADEIWRQRDNLMSDGRIETQELTVTVLFSDLADFTPIAEQLSPREMMGWLNDYMESMAGLVIAHGGVVDDYYGDAIKANFGAPLARSTREEIADDARRAAACAIAMGDAMNQINARYALQGLPPARMRVGLATGRVVAGCLGSAERMKYTTIGDVVNTAARLQAYGKEIPEMPGPCCIVIAGDTHELLDSSFDVRFVGTPTLKGKQQSVAAYRLLDCTGEWMRSRASLQKRAA